MNNLCAFTLLILESCNYEQNSSKLLLIQASFVLSGGGEGSYYPLSPSLLSKEN